MSLVISANTDQEDTRKVTKMHFCLDTASVGEFPYISTVWY